MSKIMTQKELGIPAMVTSQHHPVEPWPLIIINLLALCSQTWLTACEFPGGELSTLIAAPSIKLLIQSLEWSLAICISNKFPDDSTLYRDCTLSLKSNYILSLILQCLVPGLFELFRTERDEHCCSTWELGRSRISGPHSDSPNHHMLMGPSSKVYACSGLKGPDTNSLYWASSSANHFANCHQNDLPKTQGDTTVQGPRGSLLSSQVSLSV